ncbi:toll/interleukin-1 receptor domain-containing protein [Hyalangium rubrum]|uniref:Toll/interleukin-1 receptor domain-containing protein n=1 Tax=Hyalangium rubrum TaxID=3103134 RepID=A0ABU5HL46_9BACT|nr:toll/interleukin-1 receptor domain-containing protein [Hyalangium sp. s54d21]MDY7232810.1 toll/interleukin-1 receptor domain-containing protein [Hyalangium sp. s54d21]
MAKLFFSYSHADEALRNKLEAHLSMLRRQGLIESWHDRRITVGSELDASISRQLEVADVILLLVSSDFLASEYCYSKEMMRALERHDSSEARVIPVILRPCDWHSAPFGKLLAAPRDGKAITMWPNEDEALTDVAVKVREAVKELGARQVPGGVPQVPSAPKGGAAFATASPLAAPERLRSSNLRVKKEFSELDQDQFLHDAFEYTARFFEGSLGELQERNADIKTRYQRIDARRFVAHVYRNGEKLTECSISLASLGRRDSIAFSHGASASVNGINEMLNVEHDSQSLYLKPLGMSSFGQSRDEKLSHQGAAEYLWALLMERLQR